MDPPPFLIVVLHSSPECRLGLDLLVWLSPRRLVGPVDTMLDLLLIHGPYVSLVIQGTMQDATLLEN